MASNKDLNKELTESIVSGNVPQSAVPDNYSRLAAERLSAAQNMGDFGYDFNADPVFKSLQNSYMRQAQTAANNASAQAAARTGGYGNSYGATAASGAYNSSLGDLYSNVPDLEQNAYGRYKDKRNDYYTQSDMYRTLGNDAYEKNITTAQAAAQLGDYTPAKTLLGIDPTQAVNEDLVNMAMSVISHMGTEGIPYAQSLLRRVLGSDFNTGSSGTGTGGTSGGSTSSGTGGSGSRGSGSGGTGKKGDAAPKKDLPAQTGNVPDTTAALPEDTGTTSSGAGQKSTVPITEFAVGLPEDALRKILG